MAQDDKVSLDGSTTPATPAVAGSDPLSPRLTIPLASYHFNNVGRHVSGHNEFTPGIGISVPVSPQVEVFTGIYRNSYRDNTVVAGVHYTPIQTDIGPLRVAFGATAAIAYTNNGSYAQQAPRLSHGNATLIGGLHASLDHKPSGVGVEATVIPSTGNGTSNAAMISMRYRF